MTVKSFASALALTAALCLPALATSATAAGKGKAETFNLQRTTNFNAGQTASTTAGKTRTVTSRKRTVTQTSSPATRRASPKPGRSHDKATIVARVKAHARKAGVPVSTALAVVKQESGLRAHVTGSAGEIGLMQIKCQTARGIGFKGSCKALYDADTNLRYGMKYLRMALNRGSVGYYNAGIHAKRLPKAARKYARQVASRS
jgi:soluble lytic murein transglycosylase-like protein